MIEGFSKGFNNSKVTSDTVMIKSACKIGYKRQSGKTNIPFMSGTKAAVNPTTMKGGDYGMSNRGGSSGDGPTPGFTGSGRGMAELNGAHQKV